MKRLLIVALSSCLAVLVLPAAAFAVGTMKGQVYYDPPAGANVPIPGVKVLLVTQLGGSKVGEPVITDASGNYSLTGFADGNSNTKSGS